MDWEKKAGELTAELEVTTTVLRQLQASWALYQGELMSKDTEIRDLVNVHEMDVEHYKRELVEKDGRIQALLEYNNIQVDRRREAEAELRRAHLVVGLYRGGQRFPDTWGTNGYFSRSGGDGAR
jgi:hypothetical protein